MKPHKHAELIKAWADGATIEGISPSRGIDWWMAEENPDWANTEVEYRIKPEPKPDVVRYLCISLNEGASCISRMADETDNLKIIFDGETGELKSAEVLK